VLKEESIPLVELFSDPARPPIPPAPITTGYEDTDTGNTEPLKGAGISG
jgi:hypothetical protein